MKNKEQGLTSFKTRIYFTQFQILPRNRHHEFRKINFEFQSTENTLRGFIWTIIRQSSAEFLELLFKIIFSYLCCQQRQSFEVKSDTTNNALLSNYTLNLSVKLCCSLSRHIVEVCCELFNEFFEVFIGFNKTIVKCKLQVFSDSSTGDGVKY